MEQPRMVYFWICFNLLNVSTGNSIKKTGGELEGRHFKIAFTEQISGTAFQRAPNGTVVGYSGSIPETLKWIAKRLKFKYTIVPSIYKLEPLPNGTWIGCFALLNNKEVDFIFTGLIVSPVSFAIADITATFHEEPVVMLLPAPQQQIQFWTPVKPFSYPVWLLFLAAMAAVCCVLMAVRREAGESQKKWRKFRRSDVVIANVGFIFGQGGFEGAEFRSPIKSVVLCGWMLSVLVLANSYSSCFISFAFTPRFSPLPETIEDLAYRSELEPVVVANAATFYLMDATGGPMKTLGDSLRRHPENLVGSFNVGYEKVATGCCAFIYPRFALNYLIQADYKQSRKCRTTISATPQVWDFYVFAAQKGSPYTELLSREILGLKEVGLVKHWRKDFDSQTEKCTKLEPPKIRPLKLKDLAGVFVILCIGIGLSIAAFVGEMLTKQ